MVYSDQLLNGDILIDIEQDENCLTIDKIEQSTLSKYLVAIANSNGGCLVIGMDKKYSTVYGVVQDELNPIFIEAKNKTENVEATIRYVRVRTLRTLAIIDIQSSKNIASYNGAIYEIMNDIPSIMSEPDIIKRLGLGIDSDLINSMARLLPEQSLKIESLQNTITEAGKLKKQWKTLLVGAFLGAIAGYLLPIFLSSIFSNLLIIK